MIYDYKTKIINGGYQIDALKNWVLDIWDRNYRKWTVKVKH